MSNNRKIKILFFIESLKAGGAEKVLINLVNKMDQTKFDITVQTVWRCDSDIYLVPGIRYKYLYRSFSDINHLRYRVEAELGLAYRFHVKDDYDIEVAYLECGPTKVIAQSTNKKSKKVAWVHSDFSIAHNKEFAEKTKRYYEKYDKVVCVSQKSLKSFRDYYGENIEALIVHNVVDSDNIILKSKEPLPTDVEKKRFTICSVGRLTAAKKYERLINAAVRLKQDGYLFDIWIVGEGELRQDLENQIKAHKAEDYIKLMGFRENPYPFMREADLLVCSSIFEGYSTFITEGIVLRKPILTTDCSGMHELLDEYEIGTIVENDDKEFYLGLKQCLSAPAGNTDRGQCFAYNAIRENESFFVSLLQEGK